MKKALNKRRCPRTIFVYTVQFKSIPEIIPVCSAESYSRYLAPRATPDLLYIYIYIFVLLDRELLPECCTEIYSRFGAMSQIDHV
jgi:hypothetical protein